MDSSEWKKLLLNPSAIPKLTKLTFTFENNAPSNYQLVIETLATTIIPATNKPRPLQSLTLEQTNGDAKIFDSLSHIPTLNKIELDMAGDELPSFFDGELFPPSALTLTAMKSLTKFYFEISKSVTEIAHVTDNQLASLFHALSHSSVTSLGLDLPRFVDFGSESLKFFSQLNKLQHLYLCLKIRKLHPDLIDWTDSKMFTHFVPCQFSSLSNIELHGFHLSRESFAVIAAATPDVTTFRLHGSLESNASILCLIIGCHWRNIKSIKSDFHCRSHPNACKHKSPKFTLVEFNKAKKQFPQHPRAFHQLHTLQLNICGCTTADVWFKLLQLFEKTELIRCVKIWLVDLEKAAISLMGLSFLPSFESLSGDCELPESILDAYTRFNVIVDDEIIYNELRPNCQASKFDSNYDDATTQLKMSSEFFDNAPFQFITRVVKDGMNGREAFFHDVFHSMNVYDQLVVKQLFDDNNDDEILQIMKERKHMNVDNVTDKNNLTQRLK